MNEKKKVYPGSSILDVTWEKKQRQTTWDLASVWGGRDTLRCPGETYRDPGRGQDLERSPMTSLRQDRLESLCLCLMPPWLHED